MDNIKICCYCHGEIDLKNDQIICFSGIKEGRYYHKNCAIEATEKSIKDLYEKI